MRADDVVSPVRWWHQEDFKANGVSDPICDTCSSPLDEFPAAVIGSYAACRECRETLWCVEHGDEAYFESRAFNIGKESRRPRKNCGGRPRNS